VSGQKLWRNKMTYPDYIVQEADRLASENGALWRLALCQLLTETGFKESEPRDLVMARRIADLGADYFEGDESKRFSNGDYDFTGIVTKVRALLREYAGEEA
jgi:hypothetical protein